MVSEGVSEARDRDMCHRGSDWLSQIGPRLTLKHTTLDRATPHHTPPHPTSPHHTTPLPTPPHHTPPHRTAPHHSPPHLTTPHRRIETETFPKGLRGNKNIKYSKTTYFDLLCCLAMGRNASYGAWVPQSDTKYVLLSRAARGWG